MKMLLCLFGVAAVLAGCGSSTSDTSRPAAEPNAQPTAMRDDYISGKVTDVQPGKDGYTARLVTAGGQVYFATVSRANLKENASQYRPVAVGDTLRLKGDVWQQGDQTHVTVRELPR
jgi:uncharacterized protein YceK